MWQTAWHASAGAGAGGKGSSACSTHDFLSRYGDGSSLYSEQSSGRGSSSLTTQDFLQPLERGNNRGCGAIRDGQVPTNSNKIGREPGLDHSPPGPSADRQVPGNNTALGNLAPAFGTRSSNGAMDSAANSLSRKLSESNVDPIRAVPFVHTPPLAVRDEHSVIEHSRGSDAMTDPDSSDFLARERAENLAHWSSVRLKFGMSDLAFVAKNSLAQNSLEPGLNPGAAFLKQWQQPTQGMNDPCRRPVKVPSEDDEDEEDDYMDKTREMRKDGLFQKGESGQKLDGKIGGTPRSKHSATEQRRRSKINDRFQMLRQLVPHSDQKRDKASFLLEVIEYIQILKEKVKKYENVEHGRNQDRLKSMVWDLCKRNSGAGDTAVNIDPSRLDSLVLPKEYSSPVSGVSMDIKQQQLPFGRTMGGYPVTSKPQISSEAPAPNPMATMSNASYDRENFSEAAESLPFRGRPTGHPTSTGTGGSQEHFPQQQHLLEQKCYGQGARPSQTDILSSAQSQISNEEGGSNMKSFPSKAEQRHYSPPRDYGVTLPRQHSPCAQSTGNETLHSAASRHHQQLNGSSLEPSLQESSRESPNLRQEPIAIQGGVINVSSVYSQGLLDTLTKALRSSGLDLSQANISVQIDLGKTTAATSNKVPAQTPESSTQSHQSQEHTRQAGSYPDSEIQHPNKRPKLEMDAS